MKNITAFAGITFIVALCIYFYYEQSLISKVETDNAYVEANILALKSKFNSDVVRVDVKDNQWVNKGDLLMVLDDRHVTAKLNEANSESALLHISLDKILNEIKILEQEINTQNWLNKEVLAELHSMEFEASRLTPLIKNKLVQSAGFDNLNIKIEGVKSKLKAKESHLKMLEIRKDKLILEQKSLHTNLKINKSKIEIAELELSHHRVLAPKRGFVTSVIHQAGEQVNVGDALISILPTDEIWIVANFKESQISYISENSKVEIKIDAYPDNVIHGHIESVAPIAGAKLNIIAPNYTSGNFTKMVQRVPVKVAINDLDKLRDLLKPGLSAKVTSYLK